MDDTAAIHFASQKGHAEVVRVLVSSGVTVKTTNRKGMTPLHFAVQGSHLELAKYLINKGASLGAMNKSGESPLDLVKSDEVRKLVLEWEESRLSNTEDGSKDGDDEYEDGLEKRRIGVGEESLPDAKKAKVSLMHLVEEDDTEE